MEWKAMLGPVALEQLIANHKQQEPRKGRNEVDFLPVCKLFLPWTASGTWLVTELDECGIAFGLADLGMGQPELGYISLDEIWEVVGPGGLRVERDIHFQAKKPISQYAAEARQKGYIAA